MEMWIVIGSIWAIAVFCIVLFMRGASPARSRAVAMARSREARRKAALMNKSPAEPKRT